MFPLVLLGALVLGPLTALSLESHMIKRKKAKERAKYVEALLARQREEEQRRKDVVETLLRGH